ncbi:S-adenosyl-L-methionine-dependent methyltransferase [Flagelloscypha sp. PMI_526]|nr:S-adenosyl-L-methionine-dependent methyltransferase [Flagelloscypha sp. PMI_526]
MSDHQHEHNGHHHGHGSHQHHASMNREHFDKTAEQYEDMPQVKEMTEKVANSLLRHGNFDKNVTEALDFACGPGLVSRSLSAHAKSILGIDISTGMVDLYNKRASENGLENIKAEAADILDEAHSDVLSGKLFDIIFCSAAYHHFASPLDITKALSKHLKPSGTLLVVEFKNFKRPPPADAEPRPADASHTITHFLTPEGLQDVFVQAGLEDASIPEVFEGRVLGMDVEVFVGRATKRSSQL